MAPVPEMVSTPFSSRPAEASAAAPTLMVMAISVVFLASVQTLTGALQGVGKQSVPVWNLAVGAVFKFAATWICVGIPAINVKGAPIGTIIAYVIAMILDLHAVKKYTGTHFDMKTTYIIPAAASVLMGIGAFASYRLLFMITGSNGVSTLDLSNISAYDQGCNEEFQKAMKNYFDGNATKDEAIAAFKKAIVEKYPELTAE